MTGERRRWMRRGRRLAAPLCVAVGAAVMAPVVAGACTDNTTISTNVSTVTAGSTVVVEGSGFQDTQGITISFGQSWDQKIDLVRRAAGTGDWFRQTVVIPGDSAAGPYDIYAKDGIGPKDHVSVGITVTAADPGHGSDSQPVTPATTNPGSSGQAATTAAGISAAAGTSSSGTVRAATRRSPAPVALSVAAGATAPASIVASTAANPPPSTVPAAGSQTAVGDLWGGFTGGASRQTVSSPNPSAPGVGLGLGVVLVGIGVLLMGALAGLALTRSRARQVVAGR